MTVVFDLLGFQSREHGERGIARYVQNLALAIESLDPDFVDHYLVHPHLPIPAGIEPLLSTGKLVRTDGLAERVDLARGGLFIAGSLFEQLNTPVTDVYPLWSRRKNWRTAAVLYDLIPLRFDDWYLTDRETRYEYMARVASIRNFDHLLAISDATSRDAQQLLGIPERRLSTIWAGADAQFAPPDVPRAEVAARLAARIDGLRPGYLFFPTGIDPRKNVDNMLAAYAGLPADLRRAHQLVLVCRTTAEQKRLLTARAADLGIADDDLLITGFVSDPDLVALYQAAELVVFPAIYEGFGLPVLEAMRCGAPVICSDTSSLVEVQTDPDARFDPSSVPDMTAAIAGMLEDPARRDELRATPIPDFSWERAAEITMTDLAPLAEPRPMPDDRPTLALISPVPPFRSGIAAYAARLVQPLLDDFAVTVFVEGDPTSIDPIPGAETQPLNLLPPMMEAGVGYDHVVYLIGNSLFHVDALDMLGRVPGTVIMHDARLTGLYAETWRLHPERLPEASVGAKLEELYPWRYRRSVIAEANISPETAERFGVYMCAEVVQRASRVLVHSDYAADLVELDTGLRPTVAFPLPCPDIDPLAATLERSAAPLICSFGIVWHTKRPELIIEAASRLLPEHPDLQLVLAGGAEPDYRAELETLAERLGMSEALSIPGHLTDAAFADLQQRATMAVQLRSVSNGESSGAVAETLAVGLPTIVSRLGSMSGLPDDVVVHLEPGEGPAELAEHMRRLIEQPDHHRDRREASLRFAAENSYARAAERLRSILDPSRADPGAPTPGD